LTVLVSFKDLGVLLGRFPLYGQFSRFPKRKRIDVGFLSLEHIGGDVPRWDLRLCGALLVLALDCSPFSCEALAEDFVEFGLSEQARLVCLR
jgi:hypothetical protein